MPENETTTEPIEITLSVSIKIAGLNDDIAESIAKAVTELL